MFLLFENRFATSLVGSQSFCYGYTVHIRKTKFWNLKSLAFRKHFSNRNEVISTTSNHRNRLLELGESVAGAGAVEENAGGRAETPFSVYVAGPGEVPDNIRLGARRPKIAQLY